MSSEHHVKRRGKWRQIKKAFNNQCLYCGAQRSGQPTTDPNKCLTLDRFIPREKGGATHFWNCVPACLTCNQNKRSLDFNQFIKKFNLSRYKIQKRWIKAFNILFPYFVSLQDKYNKCNQNNFRSAYFNSSTKELIAVINGLKDNDPSSSDISS